MKSTIATSASQAFMVGSALLLSGCIASIGHPEAPAAVRLEHNIDSFYASRGSYTFGGYDGVIDAFHDTAPHAELSEQYDPPAHGTFVRVRTKSLEMSMGGKVYGYISVAILMGALPYYNSDTGYDVIYEIFHDGALAKKYSYPVRRHMFVWLPLLPFSWLSAVTTSEGGAIRSTTMRFFADATSEHTL